MSRGIRNHVKERNERMASVILKCASSSILYFHRPSAVFFTASFTEESNDDTALLVVNFLVTAKLPMPLSNSHSRRDRMRCNLLDST